MKNIMLGLLLLLAMAAPARAEVEGDTRWGTLKRTSDLFRDPVTAPYGWRVGGALQSPWSAGVTLGYVWPAPPAALKLGSTIGVWNDRGWVVSDLSEARLYGAVLYYLTSGYVGGPYIEAGVGLARSKGGVLDLPWPVLPHAGFGTQGRFDGDGLGWDLEFVAVANGMISLEGALLF